MLRYAITDRRLLAKESPGVLGAPFIRDRQGADEWESRLVAQASALAARGDIDYLQLREKDLTPAELADLARRILQAFRTHSSGIPSLPDHKSPGAPSVRAADGWEEESPGAPFIRDRKGADEWDANLSRRPKLLINSRADVAIAVGADGVHLTSSPGELSPAQVRQLYSGAGLPPPTISLSCHTLADVIAARGLRSEDELCLAPNPATAPDLILFGPVFEKRVGGQLIAEGSGLKLLRQACAAASPIPVLALGGITEENTAECIDAGASGIAAIRMFSL